MKLLKLALGAAGLTAAPSRTAFAHLAHTLQQQRRMKTRLLRLTAALLCATGSLHAQYALQFGSGKWLQLGYDAAYNTPTFSIEGWVYPTTSSGYQCIASSIKKAAGNYKGYGLYVVDGRPEIGGYDASHTYQYARASAQIGLNQWAYIKGYYDGSSWHLIVNGKEVASATRSYAPNDGGGDDDKFYVGADYSGDYFQGKIDNVRYYDVAGVNNYRASYPDTSDPHLILAYYFNAGSGTTVANDAVNYPGYTLTLNNSPAWVHSPINYSQNAINLDGSNDYVQVANNAALQSANFSVEVWVNRTSGGTGYETVLSYLGGGNNTGYAIYVHDNKWKVAYGNGSPYQYIEGPAVVNGAWTHVAATYDGSSVVLYINGALYSSTPVASISPNTTTPMYLGADYSGSYFHGSIDEVRIWNSARTGAEIGANWQSPIGLTIPSGLAAYLSFDQGYVAGDNTGLVNVIDGTENGLSAVLISLALTGPGSNFVEPWQPGPAPEIAVQQPAGTDLADGASTIDFGNLTPGSSVTKTFTITNSGTADLTVGAITTDGANAADFTVDTSGMSGTVAPGNSTTFTVTFTAGSGGARNAAIHIANNDSYENPFDIVLTASVGYFGTLVVTPSMSASDLVTALLGPGVTVVGTPTLTSAANQSGTFSGGVSVGLGIESGVVLTTGNATLLPGHNSVGGSGERLGDGTVSSPDFSTELNTAGDSDLNAIVAPDGNATVDAAVLEFRFKLGDGSRAGSVTMNYLFGSDEYIEFVGQSFNDVFAFFVDGQNIALVPSTSSPVSIANINPTNHSNFYRNNVPNQNGYPVAGFPVVLDGLTTVLSANVNIGPGEHTMKFAIADVGPIAGDPAFDSAVFLQGGSFVEGAPEIAVEQPAGTDLVDGTASIDFSSVAVGSSSAARTFTITNPGTARLTVVGITKDGANPGDFTVDTTGMSATVAAGGSTTFTVTFTPGATGARSAAIHIASDDGDENPFDITLTGSGSAPLAPEIAVEQPVGTDLVDGTASIGFGSVNVGGSSAAKTFTITNTGTADLTVGTITKDGANAGDFTVDTTGMSATVAPGGSTTFTVTFTPGATGARSAAIHIANNDSNENPFDIALTGSGSVPLAPEIAVEQPAGTDLVDGTASVDFGSVAVGGSSAAKTFTITNSGTADLTVGAITKDGANAGDFAVDTTGMSATVAPGGSTTFTVTFTPGATGARSAAIHIANNDSDENPFDIALTGSGIAGPPACGATLGSYALGESGSVGAPPIYLDLVDSVGGHNLNGSQNISSGGIGTPATASLLTTGLAAPGSTAALELNPQASPDKNAGWYMGGSGYGLTDNWRFELWFRPAETTDSSSSHILAATDAARTGSAQAVSLELHNNKINLLRGTDQNTRVDGASYTVNTWYKLVVTDIGGKVSLYINDLPVITDHSFAGPVKLDLVRLGIGPEALTGRGAAGAFDEMRVCSIPVPEIAVEQPAGTDLVDGSASISFGSVAVGSSSAAQTFTIRNTGTADLTVGAITKGGANAGDFTVDTAGMSATVAPGGSTTFTVTFTPGATGARSAAIHIANNDSDENPFDIALTGNGSGGGGPPACGATLGSYALGEAGSVGASPTYLDLVDSVGAHSLNGQQGIASTGVGGTVATATIITTGLAAPGSTAAIELNPQQSPDRNAGWYMGGSGYGLTDNWRFELWFRPAETTSASQSHIFAATDAARSGSPQAVSLELHDNQINLLRGNDEATRVVGASYTVNTWYKLVLTDIGGKVSLYINDVPVITDHSFAGPVKLDLVRLGFGPEAWSGRGAAGAFDEMRVCALAPEIAVEQPAGTDLVDGTASIDFGSVAVGSSSAARTFTIKNPGTAGLTVVGITKDGANPGDFTVATTGMSATVAPGGSTTFTVTFTPGATGARSAAIHIASDDGDENPFDIALSGLGFDCSTVPSKSAGVTNGDMHILLVNAGGWASVQGFQVMDNCTVAGTAYDSGDNVITPPGVGGVGPLSLVSRTDLPAGTVKVLLIATKNAAGPAAVNVMAKNFCNAGTSFDPIITTVEVLAGDRVEQRHEGLLAAEHYLYIANGQPGLRRLEVEINGRAFVANLADGQVLAADLRVAMREGGDNVVILRGYGDVGSSAFVSLTDTPTGTEQDLLEVVTLQLQPVADGLRLAWPETLTGWQLQSSPRAEGEWATVDTPPTVEHGQWTVNIAPTARTQFYRLRPGTAARTSTPGATTLSTPTPTHPQPSHQHGLLW